MTKNMRSSQRIDYPGRKLKRRLTMADSGGMKANHGNRKSDKSTARSGEAIFWRPAATKHGVARQDRGARERRQGRRAGDKMGGSVQSNLRRPISGGGIN